MPFLSAHDYEPQHYGEFAEHDGEDPMVDLLLILRPQDAGDAESQISEAVEHQPDAEDPWKEP